MQLEDVLEAEPLVVEAAAVQAPVEIPEPDRQTGGQDQRQQQEGAAPRSGAWRGRGHARGPACPAALCRGPRAP